MIGRMTTNALATLLMLGTMMQALVAFASGNSELKAFPAAKDGMQRFVIELEHKERGEEDGFKVEIIVGKEMLTDGVNLYRLGNIIEPRTLQGWGYTYYEVVGKGEAMSTMMAPPEGTPMVKQFVTGAPLLVPYNSRLPIVVYAPTGYAVRYRIWQANDTFLDANKN